MSDDAKKPTEVWNVVVDTILARLSSGTRPLISANEVWAAILKADTETARAIKATPDHVISGLERRVIGAAVNLVTSGDELSGIALQDAVMALLEAREGEK